MKTKAFTLAEVLITITVIGVVAALTLPSLISRRIEKENIVKLKKVYSNLQNAFNMAMVENGPVSNWVAGSNDCHNVWDKIVPYLSPIEKDCTGLRNSGCFAGTYKDFKGTSNMYQTFEWHQGCKAKFADGTSISLEHIPWYTGLFSIKVFGYLSVDLNGKRGPNQFDRDTFSFVLYNKGIFPGGDQRLSPSTWPPEVTLDTRYGNKAAWVIYNGNMDYLHCLEKLSWNGAHSCDQAK